MTLLLQQHNYDAAKLSLVPGYTREKKIFHDQYTPHNVTIGVLMPRYAHNKHALSLLCLTPRSPIAGQLKFSMSMSNN